MLTIAALIIRLLSDSKAFTIIAQRHAPAIHALTGSTLLAMAVYVTTPARADTVTSCGGFAMLGGAQINCTHTQPSAPPQFCTFSWTLMRADNTLGTVQGSFLLPPGANSVTVYQGGGFSAALSNPVILCQGKKSR